MPGIEITANKTLCGWGQVSNIVDNFELEWLLVNIENRVAIDVKLEHVSAVDWAALLSF